MRQNTGSLLLLILTLFMCSHAGVGQDQDCFVAEQVPPERNVMVEMQVVALPQNAAIPLIKELLNPASTDQAYEKIQQLLISGSAKLIGWPTVTCHTGQRATVESVHESRYATEFSGGGVDIFLNTDDWDFVKQDSKIKGIQFNAVPEAFETRPTGVTLEVEPVLSSDGQQIRITVAAEHVRLREMRKVTVEREPGPEKLTVEQPDFDKNRVTTSLTLKNGQRILLGSFTVAEHPDHMELFLLKAEEKKE